MGSVTLFGARPASPFVIISGVSIASFPMTSASISALSSLVSSCQAGIVGMAEIGGLDGNRLLFKKTLLEAKGHCASGHDSYLLSRRPLTDWISCLISLNSVESLVEFRGANKSCKYVCWLFSVSRSLSNDLSRLTIVSIKRTCFSNACSMPDLFDTLPYSQSRTYRWSGIQSLSCIWHFRHTWRNDSKFTCHKYWIP